MLPLLSKRPELRDVRVDSGDENTEVQVTVNRDRAAAYGFNAQEVAQYIGIALRGAPLREFRTTMARCRCRSVRGGGEVSASRTCPT